MNIEPISSISPMSSIFKQSNANSVSGDNGFKDILSQLVQNVNETDRVSQEDIVKMVSGNADDLHTVMINSEKAELATLALVQVRNKILDAYNEIMRVNL
jgi:flagellar hook-basal body complex protein FliE